MTMGFNSMAEAMQHTEETRRGLIASVSHDLRTPMTTIAGFVDGILDGTIKPEKQEHYLRIISSEVHRLSRLVSQLLDVSRLESGDRKFNFTDFDVAELSRLILISLEQKIDEKRLDVSFDAEEDVMCANGDKDAVHQVVYNLCHNAIKFSREGGKFEISISHTDDKKVKISIFDEGQSISAEDEKLVFDRFYKTDKSRSLDKSGVGLGLYIVQTIINQHKGDLLVKSVEGEYTEFTFSVPASDPKILKEKNKRRISEEN
jgi:signal transduction histidine kinase